MKPSLGAHAFWGNWQLYEFDFGIGARYSPALTADRSRVSSSAVHLRLTRAMSLKSAYDMITVEGVDDNCRPC